MKITGLESGALSILEFGLQEEYRSRERNVTTATYSALRPTRVGQVDFEQSILAWLSMESAELPSWFRVNQLSRLTFPAFIVVQGTSLVMYCLLHPHWDSLPDIGQRTLGFAEIHLNRRLFYRISVLVPHNLYTRHSFSLRSIQVSDFRWC